MKTLLYAMMIYPMTVMVQDNDSFKLVLSKNIAKTEIEQVKPPKKVKKFDPKTIQIGIKVNEENAQ
ncbi:hypothetical protein FG297_22695 [Vibrio alginolyticus]|nr:hypothetical protein [Vibrio parahaemolyticus]EHA1078744.1 hypothetical protein [Vibrio alginolyticus]EHA1137184.1 hypothetical protein [Vibrio alginolyticus]EJC6974867.1 hypothetical protein [Vibrio parahaemolyticus]EJC7127756.1 hypothetical protein [Vibrio parahaemolyticus]